MEITEQELRRLVAETDDVHRQGMTSFVADNRELIFGDLRHARTSGRRSFLRGAGMTGLTLAMGSALLPWSRLAPAAAQEGGLSTADLARFAASLEFAAVQAYQAAVETGKLSQPVIDAGTTFAGHHQEHGQAFVSFVGEDVPANETVLNTFGPMIANAADEAAIVRIAFDVENAAAATYLFGLGVIEDIEAAKAVASILPVESQHAVVLGSVLGLPVDDQALMPAFEPTDKALDPTDFPITAA